MKCRNCGVDIGTSEGIQRKEIDLETTGDIDANLQPVKCKCGYGDGWDGLVLDQGEWVECPKCGKKYTFSCEIKFYEFED